MTTSIGTTWTSGGPTYRAMHPNAVRSWSDDRMSGTRGYRTGSPGLLRSEGFHAALRTEPFYRRDFDEQFQPMRLAITFGYRSGRGERNRRCSGSSDCRWTW